MYNLIQHIKKIGSQSLFKVNNKVQQPLLNNDELLELLLRVQINKDLLSHNKESAFQKLGNVRSTFRGQGMDYEESRHYQAGDDPRYMNWQLSAKTGQHYMKVFREERQPGVFILVDRRSSMRFGTQQRLKLTQAVRAAAITAFSAQENNYSIGGVILDSELEWFKGNQNKQAVFDFLHQAARPASPIVSQKEITQQANLSTVLRMLNEVLTTGSTIYLISDFHDLEESSQATLLQLSATHKVHALHIVDPAEITLPKSGDVSLKSSVTNKNIDVNTLSLSEQTKYQDSSKGYFSGKKCLFENIAIPYIQIMTSDENIEKKVTA